MKTAVIDVGSNSVRVGLIANGKTLFKRLKNTRLGEGLQTTGKISVPAAERTLLAVKEFVSLAKESGADNILVFATAAVRNAQNGFIFLEKAKQAGIDVKVLSGEEEALAGVLGALKDKSGGIIDIGGASTEVCVSDGKRIVYSKSIPLGTVRIANACGEAREAADEFIGNAVSEFGEVPVLGDFYAIGGTATALAAFNLKLEVYESEIINGYRMTLQDLKAAADKLYSMALEERIAAGVEPGRADLIAGGALTLCRIAEKSGLKEVVISDDDNIEGYYIMRKEYL